MKKGLQLRIYFLAAALIGTMSLTSRADQNVENFRGQPGMPDRGIEPGRDGDHGRNWGQDNGDRFGGGGYRPGPQPPVNRPAIYQCYIQIATGQTFYGEDYYSEVNALNNAVNSCRASGVDPNLCANPPYSCN